MPIEAMLEPASIHSLSLISNLPRDVVSASSFLSASSIIAILRVSRDEEKSSCLNC